MKRILAFFSFIFLTHLCFALPNIKLYDSSGECLFTLKSNELYAENEELCLNIHNGKLYDEKGNSNEGTISEDKETITITFCTEDKPVICYNFDKKTGYMIKIIDYSDGNINSFATYEYEKGKLSKETFHNAEGFIDIFIEYAYDKKTGICIKETEYTAKKQLSSLSEYDRITGIKIKTCIYDDKGNLKTQTSYDKETGNAIERIVYHTGSKKPNKWKFLTFDKDGVFTLNKDYYLSSSMTSYRQLEDYEADCKDTTIDWNKNYSARIRKYSFNANNSGYQYLMDLKNKHYLCLNSFTLCNKKSNLYYCFTTDENDEIDISSCYEIELIKKPTDYSMFKKDDKSSGAFGLSIGMTYEEVETACGGSEPEHISDDRYYVKPKKAHPLFEKYIVWISDSVGLYYIKGLSREIPTSSYGTEAKNKFNDLLYSLEKKYGKFKLTDTLKPDYYLKDNQYWMSALRDGARTYQANRNITEDNYTDFNGIASIALGIAADYSTRAYIWIEYAFINSIEAEQAKDDVL